MFERVLTSKLGPRHEHADSSTSTASKEQGKVHEWRPSLNQDCTKITITVLPEAKFYCTVKHCEVYLRFSRAAMVMSFMHSKRITFS